MSFLYYLIDLTCQHWLECLLQIVLNLVQLQESEFVDFGEAKEFSVSMLILGKIVNKVIDFNWLLLSKDKELVLETRD